jgi:hypothetical protein
MAFVSEIWPKREQVDYQRCDDRLEAGFLVQSRIVAHHAAANIGFDWARPNHMTAILRGQVPGP